jgi:endonuclease/exonuclease/phosphatase family metal-dependent hydrolase
MILKKITKWGLVAANVIVALTLFFSVLASFVSPAVFTFPAYFALVFPVIFFLNLAFVLLWLLLRKWYFLISLCLMLLSFPQLKENFSFLFKNPPVSSCKPDFTILSYNTHMMGLEKKHNKENKKINPVIQYVLSTNADIVCLQEFMVSTKEKYLTEEDAMKAFKKYPYHHIYFKAKEKRSWLGIATFSKFPIINRQTIAYTSSANASIYSDINIRGKTIRVVNNHLESNQLTEKDKAMPYQLKENFNTDLATHITLYFSKKLGAAYKLRAMQADEVKKVVSSSPYPVVVCGDFNDVPSSYAYTKIRGKLKDSFLEQGKGFGWTFNEKHYRFRIDYIFHDPSLILLNFKTDKVPYSDHFPLKAAFSL